MLSKWDQNLYMLKNTEAQLGKQEMGQEWNMLKRKKPNQDLNMLGSKCRSADGCKEADSF